MEDLEDVVDLKGALVPVTENSCQELRKLAWWPNSK